MPRPLLTARLTAFQAEVDTLLGWGTHLPTGHIWQQRLNEMRLVRATLAWEDYLEETFICYLRGSRTVSGRTLALSVPGAANWTDAYNAARGTAPFGKWINEGWTLSRAATLFAVPHPYAVLAGPFFKELRVIRNRIVHRSDSVILEFRRVVASLYGTTRRGMSPGILLSDKLAGVPRVEGYLAYLRAAATVIAG